MHFKHNVYASYSTLVKKTIDEKGNQKPTLLSGPLHQKKQRARVNLYISTNCLKTSYIIAACCSVTHSSYLVQQYCLYVPAHGQVHSRGRQKTSYMQHVSKTINGDTLMEEKCMCDAASDRVVWRKVVKAASCFSATE